MIRRERARSSAKTTAAVVTLVLVAVVAAGCAGSRSAVRPTKTDCTRTTRVRFAVAPDINEDADGRPATVDLYVMFLRDRHAFDDADFHALWKDPRARLGDDLVGDSELVVAYPGSEPYRDYDNGNGARYVGIVGIFRAWESLNWRRLIPFPPLAGGCPENGTGRARNVTVHVTKRGLSVSLEAAVPGAVAP